MGLPSKRSFDDLYDDPVKEMTRNLVNYVKSLRDGVGIQGQMIGTGTRASGTGIGITLTPDGFPVLPPDIVQKPLTKRELEDCMRAYLGQHYCQ
jgi:hypothetical protein